ncbi:hypothetical protein [Methylibium petroleiphilum]|nr:hypothetical protein [Methylibium petroleiphilum]
MTLFEHQTPGVVEFFGRMPGRVESAFIRGLIYQWMLDNQDAPDFEERLARVVNGPGGRLLAMPIGGSQVMHRKKPGPKPGSRKPVATPTVDVPRAQIVMPVVDAPRQPVREQAAHHGAAVGAPLHQPAPAPVHAAPVPPPTAAPAPLDPSELPQPASAADAPTDAGAITDDAMDALAALDTMF